MSDEPSDDDLFNAVADFGEAANSGSSEAAETAAEALRDLSSGS